MTAATEPKPRQRRDARLDLRPDAATWALIVRAAGLSQQTLSAFCRNAVTAAARATLAEPNGLTLSDRDRAAFFDALITPAPLNARLARAVSEHRRRVRP